MPDQNPFPPQKPVTGPPPPAPVPPDPLKQLNKFISPLNVMEFYQKVGGKVTKFADDAIFDDKVIDPAKEALEDFLEEKAAKMPIKKVTGGAGLFIIEHTIISHTSRGADPEFVTVVRADGSTYRYPDLSFQPRRLPRGERLLDAPPGTIVVVSGIDGTTTVVPASSPFAAQILSGSVQPEKIKPVNGKAIDNEERAQGIRRELVTERADP